MPGAALDDLERIAGAAKLPAAGAAQIEAALGGRRDPDAARELALRAARLYSRRPATARRRSACTGRCWRATRRTSTRWRRWRPSTARRARMPAGGGARTARGGRAGSRRRRRAAPDGGGARCTRSAATLRRAIASLQRLARPPTRGTPRRWASWPACTRRWGRCGRARRPCWPSGRAFTEDPRERAAFWARVGELRLAAAEGLDGAAEAYREALESAPEDPIVAVGAGGDRGAPRGLVDAAGGAHAPPVGHAGADQVPVLLKLARNAERQLHDIEQAVGFLRQVLDVDERNALAYAELERILRANERWYDLVDVLGKHAEVEARRGPQAERAGAAGGDRRRLGQGARLARRRRGGAGEGPRGGAGQRGRAAVAGAAARARRALGRRRASAGARGRRRRAARPRSPRSSSARRNLLAKEAPTRPRSSAALLRALDADPTHRPTLAALEKLARDGG